VQANSPGENARAAGILAQIYIDSSKKTLAVNVLDEARCKSRRWGVERMKKIKFAHLLLISVSLAVAGCTGGLTTPELRDFFDAEPTQEADENLILNEIRCEIRTGVENALYDKRFNPPTSTTGKSPDWLLKWGAKVSYVLTGDDKASLNPGVSWENPFRKMNTFVSLAFGVQSSAESTRKETGAVTYAFSDLLKQQPCNPPKGILIHSDLKIPEFISDKVFITRVPGTVPTAPRTIDTSTPQILNAASEEITFVVIYGGNFTPSWKFVRISVNPSMGTPLLSGTRTKTQYASITLGPIEKPADSVNAPRLSGPAETIDSANLIGHAVSTAIQNSLNILP